jgi:GH15 family glucan-1,4-alpha-glucosidase
MSWGNDASALSTRVNNWLGTQSADDILAAEQQNWDEWHALESPPPQMQAAELALYRQSTAVLRMGQVRESGPAYGQILASLPPGIWNISWPRDQSYATLGLAQSGHHTEAEASVQFILNGNAGNYAAYLGLTDYLVSVARYYGDGTEESDGASCPDGSDAGPNIELDDFGLFLQAWAATPALAAASTTTVQTGVADPLIQLIQSNNLLLADSSIWERHWNDCFPNGRKQFVWSSIQAAAGLSQLPGQNYQDAAARLRAGLQQTSAQGGPVTLDANGQCPLLASAPEEICDGCGPLDASGVEAINLGLIPPDSDLARGSLAAWMGLQNPSGGFRRNDDGTGSSNPYPWYDDQEWLFIDMRMALAMTAVGTATANPELQASANTLIQHVTDIGTVNAGLLPELLSDGHYTPEDDADHLGLGSDPGQQAQGAHPMVGFGAGSYVLAMEILRR